MRFHRRLRKRVPGLSSEQRGKLLTGTEFFGPAFADEAAERAAWNKHRDEMLAAWIAENPAFARASTQVMVAVASLFDLS